MIECLRPHETEKRVRISGDSSLDPVNINLIFAECLNEVSIVKMVRHNLALEFFKRADYTHRLMAVQPIYL